jgi:hypothetical protein
MTPTIRRTGAAIGLIALFLCAPAALAAAPSPATRNFEVISTDGIHLVVRDETGIQEYTVPEDFKFTVDGKELGAAELNPGMRGTATLTDATSTRAVHVTHVKMGTVISQTGRSVTIKGDDGQIQRFTQSEADARGMQILVDGKPVRVFNLNPGDRLEATIVTTGTPEILTAQALDESLAAAGEAAESGATRGEAAAAPEPAPVAAREASSDEATTAADVDDSSVSAVSLWMLVLLFVVVALFVYFGLRNPRVKPLPRPETRT